MAREAELRLREQLSRLRSLPLLRGARLEGELERLQRQLDRIVAEPSDEEIWRSVELARNPDRPYTLDYVERLLEDWFELHGDRAHGDDAAVVAGSLSRCRPLSFARSSIEARICASFFAPMPLRPLSFPAFAAAARSSMLLMSP